MRSRYPRLTLADRSNLSLEAPGTPCHIGGLAVIASGPLVDARGEPDLATIKRGLERRLSRVPVLRRVVRRTPPLCGPPVWVDDADFSIDRHVRTTRVRPPGGEAELLEAAELALRPLLDRSHPLWELWLLTGIEGGRMGVLFKLHHAIADGLAAVALIASLFDLHPGALDPPAEAWTPQAPPPARALLADSLRTRAAAVASTLRHPLRTGRGIGLALLDTTLFLRQWSAAPRTSLNRPLGLARRIRVLHLDLEELRSSAPGQRTAAPGAAGEPVPAQRLRPHGPTADGGDAGAPGDHIGPEARGREGTAPLLLPAPSPRGSRRHLVAVQAAPGLPGGALRKRGARVPDRARGPGRPGPTTARIAALVEGAA